MQLQRGYGNYLLVYSFILLAWGGSETDTDRGGSKCEITSFFFF